MARRTITEITILGLTAALAGCSSGLNGDDRTYSFADVEDFQPRDGKFLYSAPPIGWTVGEQWTALWSDPTAMVFEPAECVTFMEMWDVALASDASETASDGLSEVFGSMAGTNSGEVGDDYGVMNGKIRVFDSPASASRFLADLRASAAPCADGYSASHENWGATYTTDSVSVSEVQLPGVGAVLRIDQPHWTFVPDYDPEDSDQSDHNTIYVLARGNTVFRALFLFNGETVTEDDATELFQEFVEHLEEAGAGS